MWKCKSKIIYEWTDCNILNEYKSKIWISIWVYFLLLNLKPVSLSNFMMRVNSQLTGVFIQHLWFQCWINDPRSIINPAQNFTLHWTNICFTLKKKIKLEVGLNTRVHFYKFQKYNISWLIIIAEIYSGS